jgi:hypothetical protein
MNGSQTKFNSTLPTIKEAGSGDVLKPSTQKLKRRNTINTELESFVSSNLSKSNPKIATLKRQPSGSSLIPTNEVEKGFLKLEDASKAGQTVTKGWF